MSRIEVSAFRWVPPFARGLVRDLRVRWALEEAGLAYEPWLIGAADLPLLRETVAGAPLAMDIMTERHEITTRLQKALSESPEVFGAFRTDGDPAILLESVHHLYKLVNQRPLVRPGWYFDVAVQGEGITDVTTHLVDLTQWMTGGGKPFDYAGDVELVQQQAHLVAVAGLEVVVELQHRASPSSVSGSSIQCTHSRRTESDTRSPSASVRASPRPASRCVRSS